MKKIFVWLLVFVNLFAFQAFAQQDTSGQSIIKDPSSPSLPFNFLGQEHYYSVTFRGNGEAIVTQKIIIYNNQDFDLYSLNLRVPKIIPQDILALQVIKQPGCRLYDIPSPIPLQRNYLEQPVPSGNSSTMPCLEYEQPDYSSWSYGNYKYQKAPTSFAGDTLSITFPNAIKPNQSGSFLLYFRGFGYAKKNSFGAYDFAFESLKVEDKIRNLTIGITTDSNLYLKGAKANVNYRFEESYTNALKTAPQFGAAAPNAQFDSYYNQIGQGQITKTAKDLQSLDSYTVKGTYADSYLKLNAKGILFGIFLLVIVITLIVIAVKKLLIRFSRVKVTPFTDKKIIPSSSSPRIVTFGKALLLSFLASLFILIYTFVLIIVPRIFYSSLYDLQTIIQILTVIISIPIYLLLLFCPAIYLGRKNSLWWGILTFTLTILWLIFYLLILILIVSLTANRGTIYNAIPMMK